MTANKQKLIYGLSSLAIVAAYVYKFGLPERDDSFAKSILGAIVGGFVGLHYALLEESKIEKQCTEIKGKNFVMFVPAKELSRHSELQACLTR